ncbi:PhzF family phenazine biosynthesis protein [Streptomyces sp. A7024]|uniref:PhzF family phenazine biosynthesis protein n=1 Tax=Streptomyces coryli TaxID=1128680 RepID=A0A6G4TTR1_9ACTN|nr:PhzF family phenazine biosynthesis protein [Streptomyces coryli]NGN62930.1 PhzF family phenazine biosynthesis protein [Streptomyces coryli]
MRIRIVDAFTDRPFTGNPAGVVLLDGGAFPPDSWMQRVAAEVGASETCFAHPLDDGADWALRWFTPACEVDLCGHGTLATTHVIAPSAPVSYRTRGGILTAIPRADGAYTLDFPVARLTPAPVPAEAKEAIGAEPVRAYACRGGIRDLLLELSDEQAVRSVAPDLAAVARLAPYGLIVTAAAKDPAAGYDFVSRLFDPAQGIDEDPVTGSAHTALAPLWSARLGRDELTGLQASARSGLVGTKLRGERVELTGRAVTVIDGELLARP